MKHSKVESLNQKAGRQMNPGDLFNTLDILLILSAVISGVFFWKNAGGVFDIFPFEMVNSFMAVLFGIVASEGAFFGWRHYRKMKLNMTNHQLTISTVGAIVSIVTSGISTVAAVMLNAVLLPPSLLAYRPGIVLIAIAFPLVVQAMLAMGFALFSQDTIENFENAKNEALVFSQKMRLERARIMSLVDAVDEFFDQKIEAYQQNIAPQLAQRLFDEGADAVLNFGMGYKTQDENAQTMLPESTPKMVYELQKYVNGRWLVTLTGSSVRQLSEMAQTSITGNWRVMDENGRIVARSQSAEPTPNGATPDPLAR